MECIYDKQKLKDVLKDFHEISGLRIAVFDTFFNEIVAYPDGLCGFCRKIRMEKDLQKMCTSCDKNALINCTEVKTGQASQASQTIYRCHMGLIEAVSPIKHGEFVLGYIMIGQTLEESDIQKQWVFTKSVCGNYGILSEDYFKEFNGIIKLSKDKILSAAKIMSICATYIFTQNLIGISSNSFASKVIQLIDENLESAFTLTDLCKTLYVGKTKLCTDFKKEFGQSVGTIIQQKRIERAKKLLTQTDKSISEIALQVGIPDCNYFIKIFKTHIGITPAKFRKT